MPRLGRAGPGRTHVDFGNGLRHLARLGNDGACGARPVRTADGFRMRAITNT
jgi:hypothetical protein